MKNITLKKGFTLIELLIVIAILGTLAVVVLVALNPIQQLARTRDAGRISTVAQLGHSIEANATSNNGVYLTPSATWVTSLVNAGEVTQAPTLPGYTAPSATTGKATPATCSGAGSNNQGGICYITFATNSRAVVYASLESGNQNAKCSGNNVAMAVYSTANGRGGVICVANYGTLPGDPGATGYPTCGASPCTATNQLVQN